LSAGNSSPVAYGTEDLVWFLLEGGMGLAQRNARKSRRIRPSVNDGTN
jgi:hypothetical protein